MPIDPRALEATTPDGRVQGFIADLLRRVGYLERANAAAPVWTPVTFAANWINNGGGWTNVSYRLVRDVVELRGLAQRSTTVLAANVTATLFTLPAGYRPTGMQRFAAPGSAMGVATNPYVNVAADGTVSMASSAMMVVGDVVSLSGLSFSVV